MRRLAPLLATLALPATALAQPASDGPVMVERVLSDDRVPTGATLSFSVSESIEADPDLALVSGGVSTLAPTATEALRQNSEAMTRVIAAVRRVGIAAADVQTQGIGLDPQYDYQNRRDGSPPVFTGYRANNTVSLRIKDVGRVGPILDALVTAGATNLSGPTYTLENAGALERAARLRTITKAQGQADAYARAAGFRTARLTAISEGGYSGPQPLQAMAFGESRTMAQSPPPPTAPGRVRSEVSMNFSFALDR